MNTQTQTSPEVKPATNAIESCLRTAAAHARMAELLRKPEFDSFDATDSTPVKMELIQLFPRGIEPRSPEATKRALAIAKVVPGEWMRDDDGAWRCNLTGEFKGFTIHLHYVEPEKRSVARPANLIDLDATAKALAAA